MSSAKRLIKILLPTGVLELVRRLRAPRYLWRGIFDTFESVPAGGAGFQTTAGVEQSFARTRQLLKAHETDAAMPMDDIGGENRTFLALASLLASLRQGLTVLEAGGGGGAAYVYLLNSLPRPTALEYHIVDLPGYCAVGRTAFEQHPRVHYHPELPLPDVRPDIAIANGALQYFPDYEATLEAMVAGQPMLLALIDLPVGIVPTFATCQVNVFGGVPAWFFNLEEILGIMERKQYTLVLNSRRDIFYDLSNFPEPYRLKNLQTLVFAHRGWVERLRHAAVLAEPRL